jgi:SAM-dependent methyltransferase
MRTIASPRSSAPPAIANDWTGRPGALARIFPAEHVVRLVCRAVPESQRAALTALDVGCGNGRNSIALACLGFGRVIAIDPLESALAEARANATAAGLAIETRCAAADALPLSAASADLAVAWGLLFQLGGPAQTAAVMEELGRVLRPGGRLVADWRTEDDALRGFAEAQLAPRTIRLRDDAPAELGGLVYSFFDAADVERVHADAGFLIEQFERREVCDVRTGSRYAWWQTCAQRRTN